ncbi:hypothetical protein D3C87_460110 [compost metagenome]
MAAPTSTSIEITTQIEGDKIVVTAKVLDNSFLPDEIFIYKNNGTTTLGDYYGICDKDELTRFQVWSGTAIPVFGNQFVRYGSAKIVLDIQADVQRTIDNLVKTATDLSTALKTASSSTQIVNIQ